MHFIIKEWPNKMATLMTEDGVVLWTFSDAEEARRVCHAWRSLQKDRPAYQIGYLDQ